MASETGCPAETAPPGNAAHSIRIDRMHLDQNGPIYADGRPAGGMDIIECVGPGPSG